MRFYRIKTVAGEDTPVHVAVHDASAFRSAEEVLGWLNANSLGSVRLARRRRSSGVSVELEVQGLHLHRSPVRFTFTPPSRNGAESAHADVQSIVALLRSRGIDVELIPE